MPLEFDTTIVPDLRKSAPKRGGRIIIPNTYVRALGKYKFTESFYVKGHLDHYKYTMERLMPLENGDYELRLTEKLLKACGKQVGDPVRLRIDKDRRTHACPLDLSLFLAQEKFDIGKHPMFRPKSQQNKFYEYLEKAPSPEVREERFVLVINAFREGLTFEQMKKNASKDKRLF